MNDDTRVIIDGNNKYIVYFDDMYCDVRFNDSNTLFDRFDLELVNGDLCAVDNDGWTLLSSEFQEAYESWITEQILLMKD